MLRMAARLLTAVLLLLCLAITTASAQVSANDRSIPNWRHPRTATGIFTVTDLAVTKSDSPDPVTAGNNLTYTITVTNNGPDVAANSSWSDTLPTGTTFVSLSSVAAWSCTTPAVGTNGLVTCSNPSFAVGSAVYTLVVGVDASIAAGTVLSNSATATTTTSDSNPGNDTGTATTTVAASAEVSLTKTDSPDPVTAGTNLTYTITVSNEGPSNAANVSMTDTLPAGTTFVSLTSPAGWSCTTPAVGAGGTVTCSIASLDLTSPLFTLVVKVDPSTANGTVLSNTATASASTSDPNPGDESETAPTTVAASADLAVTKVDTPDPVNAGSNITYTIAATNNGPSDAANVTLSDTLPANTTFVSLSSPGGWSCTTPAVGGTGVVSCSIATLSAGSDVFTLVVAVDPSTANGTTISNTATVSSSTTDSNGGNNSATSSTFVSSASDVHPTKSGTATVTAGNNITYTIDMINSGPSNAVNPSFSDALPAGETFVSLTSPVGWPCTTPGVGANGTVSCSAASLAVANAGAFTLVVMVSPAQAPGILTNTITSTAANDSNAANNVATFDTTVTASADLAITKVDTPDPVNGGVNITYTITATNNGPSNAANATLSDTLPANTTFVSLTSPAGWSCTSPAVGGTGAVNCSNASFAPGSAVFTLVVKVDVAVANGTIITNTANIDSATGDPGPGLNSATATTTAQAVSAPTATKTVATTGVQGTAVTYTITITNNMPHVQLDNPGDEFTDTLPATLTLVSATATSGAASVDIPNRIVHWNGPIAMSGTVTITINATINPAATGTVSNQGSIFFDLDNNGTNESTRLTDDPSVGGANDPTSFATAPVGSIPVLSPAMLLVLMAGLAGVALMRSSR